MDLESKQKIIHGHGHLISSSKPPYSGNTQEHGSKEDTGPPTPIPGIVINFGHVAPGIYRSSFPRASNFEHLASLGLRSILTLVAETYPSENVEFLEENRLEHFQIPIPAHKDESVVIPPERIAAALRILLDSRNHPILIHCNKGKHRTGCIVACYRKLHGWPTTAALTEYRQYAGSKARALDEKFIAGFDQALALEMVDTFNEAKFTPGHLLPTPPSSLRNYYVDD